MKKRNARSRRSRWLLACALVAASSLVSGCGSLAPARFSGSAPEFDPIAFFTGHVQSRGVFENRAGEPERQFSTSCVGHREADGSLLLDQTFTYEGGKTQQRHWHIRRVDAHRYAATANDVVGTATGEAYGNTFHWEYTVAIEPGNPLYNIRLRQWMYLQTGGQRMMNRASINKFGIQVAQVAEYFERGSGSGQR